MIGTATWNFEAGILSPGNALCSAIEAKAYALGVGCKVLKSGIVIRNYNCAVTGDEKDIKRLNTYIKELVRLNQDRICE